MALDRRNLMRGLRDLIQLARYVTVKNYLRTTHWISACSPLFSQAMNPVVLYAELKYDIASLNRAVRGFKIAERYEHRGEIYQGTSQLTVTVKAHIHNLGLYRQQLGLRIGVFGIVTRWHVAKITNSRKERYHRGLPV